MFGDKKIEIINYISNIEVMHVDAKKGAYSLLEVKYHNDHILASWHIDGTVGLYDISTNSLIKF